MIMGNSFVYQGDFKKLIQQGLPCGVWKLLHGEFISLGFTLWNADPIPPGTKKPDRPKKPKKPNKPDRRNRQSKPNRFLKRLIIDIFYEYANFIVVGG